MEGGGADLRTGDRHAQGRPAAAPDPPAQLVELGQSEALGVQDDHHGGLGHVHPHLDDGGGHQDRGVARGEVGHGGRLVPTTHASSEDPDADTPQSGLAGQSLPPVLDGGQRAVGMRAVPLLRERLLLRPVVGPNSRRTVHRRLPGLVVDLDPWAHDVDPSPGGDLLGGTPPDALHPGGARPRDEVGGYGAAPGGQLVQDGGGQVSEDRHGDGARDRGGGHDQEVGRVGLSSGRVGQTAALAQGVTLGDAETVLLIDDDQAEEGDLHRVGQQGVGTHDDRRLTGGQLSEDPTALSGGGGAGQQVDAGGAFGAAKHPEAGHGPQDRLQ